jgi:putative sigma-54 modulation protein
MKLEIVEKNYDVGMRLRNLIEKKVSKLANYFGDEATCKVVCKKDNKQYKLEINITAKNAFFRSEVVGDNMYSNLDLALPKLERQILKFNGKKKGFRISDTISDLLYLDEAPEIKLPKITKRKSFALDPITEDDAIYMLESVDHDFYIFLNSATGKTNVLYRRKDGEYGLIEVTV